MKHKKIFSLFCMCITLLMICCSFMIHVSAESSNTSTISSNDLENEKDTGLIDSYFLHITSGVKQVKISAITCGTETMAKIGFTSIEVQRSSNGTSGWVTELTPNNDTVTNASTHTKNNESKSVTGGYYYRVKLNHYAKEKGWFFPDSQSITNYSNVVWVPAS